MENVIYIKDVLRQCKIEVVNINAKDLLLLEYQELTKYFQDKRKWTLEQKNNFIESLFFGIFVHQLFIYEPKADEKYIIDGYNRIQTIKEFFNDEFSLEGLSKFNWQYNGKVFSKLKDYKKYELEHYPIIINKIIRRTSEKVLRSLYINFNT